MYHQARRNRILSLLVIVTFPFVCFLAGYMVTLLTLAVYMTFGVVVTELSSGPKPNFMTGLQYDIIGLAPIVLMPVGYLVFLSARLFRRVFPATKSRDRGPGTGARHRQARAHKRTVHWQDVAWTLVALPFVLGGLPLAALAGFAVGQLAVALAVTTTFTFGGMFATPSIGGGYIVGGLGLIYAAFTWFRGPQLLIALTGARPADAHSNLQLVDLVTSLSIGAGIPAPSTYVLDDKALGIYSAGGPGKAVIVITSGLLSLLRRDELEGVVAHEIAHIRNGDSRWAATLTALFGSATLTSQRLLSWVEDNRGDLGLWALAIGWVGLMTGLVGRVFGGAVRIAFSRTRELMADAQAVELTRDPSALISALKAFDGATDGAQTERHARGLPALLGDHVLVHERLRELERIRAVRLT